MTQRLQQSERILYQLLWEWLSQQQGGPKLLADFSRDPEGTAPRLRAFLERTDSALPPGLVSYVSGGQVEKLVNIAQAGVVYIQPTKAEPTPLPEERQELECRYGPAPGEDQPGDGILL